MVTDNKSVKNMTRIEKDFLGEVVVREDALYGVHTARAAQNFPVIIGQVPARLIRAYAMVKKACALTNIELGYLTPDVGTAIVAACDDLAVTVPPDQFPVDALQGGAGTSTNMNVNEVLANMALDRLGRPRGEYSVVHPLDSVNKHQSTNDTYPTAIKVASMFALRELSAATASLQGVFQRLEKTYADVAIVGSTERVDAVPMTLGAQFGSFAEAVARDRWRTFKCEERLRVLNLGGTAIGTGMAAPRRYILLVTEKLREVTGLPLARAENLVEQTANADAFVEVGGILSACASNVGKIADDLRLLALRGDIVLPSVQAGSSIMPGKVNPVILEHAIQIGIKVRANTAVIAECASRGSLQICEFLPLLAVSLLESLDLLIAGCGRLAAHVEGVQVDRDACKARFDRNPAIVTALVPKLGYDGATALAERLKESGRSDVRVFLEETVGVDVVGRVLAPEAIMAMGFREEVCRK
jgi:aspartate ammonia-lyase